MAACSKPLLQTSGSHRGSCSGTGREPATLRRGLTSGSRVGRTRSRGRMRGTTTTTGGATSPWTEAGWMMDTLNHGTWNMPAGNHRITVGVKADPFDKSAKPQIVPLKNGVFDGRKNDTQMLFDANTRQEKRCR